MSTKFTPGPWSTHDNIGRKGEIGIMADAAPCIIAVMGNQKAWPCEAAANALLIAAAPELYAALLSLSECGTQEHDEDYSRTCSPDHPGDCCLCAARAALAKARGE